jgi:DNA-binding transcriptional LysR family regulator
VVSHRLQQLEAHLGVRLLNRTTRQVQPTEHGLVFYNACQEVLSALEHAESLVADVGGTPQGNLRITAPLGFGRRILAPLVPAFQAENPRVDLRLRLSDHLLDLLHEAVDAAVRMAVLADSSFIVRKIADCPRVLCASPAYLEAHGTPLVPDDLLEHNCLLLRFPGSQQFRWTLKGPESVVTLPVSGRLDADDGDVLTEWALAGQGIVMKPLWEVALHLRDGRLRPLLLDYPPEPAVLVVLYPHRQLMPARIKAFADFMVEHAASAIDEPTSAIDF